MIESNDKRAGFGDEGFTLLELILVVMVATVAIAPLMSMFSNAVYNSVKPVIATEAVFLAQEKIETIIADAAAQGRGYDYIINSNYPDISNPPEFSGFSISVTVAAESLYQGVNFKLVDVTVSNSAIDDVVLSTWVAQ